MSDPTIPPQTQINATTTGGTTPQGGTSSGISVSNTTAGSTAQSLQLPATTIIPGLAKDIKVGDLIQFVMRGRSPDGLGLLYMMGQLVKASVPDHIQTGDRVHAKIERQGERLLFKILEIQAKNNETPLQTESLLKNLRIPLPEKLERQIFELLTKLAPFLPDQNLHTHAPIKDLTSNISSLQNAPQEIKSIVSQLQKIFLADNALTNGTDIFTNIRQRFSASKTLEVQTLRSQIESIIEKNTGTPEIRFFAKTLESLTHIGEQLSDSASFVPDKVKKDIEKLLKVLLLEAETESIGKTPKKNFAYFDTLKMASNALDAMLQDEVPITKSAIEKLITTITQLQPEAKLFSLKNALPVDSMRDLMQLSQNLEQFVNTINLLQQLEPIMGLMQAPELILFPFLFQGLLSFGEFAIDPNAKKQNQQKKHEKDEEESNKKSARIEKRYRYSASIQLPHLGMVHISSLQEDSHLDIQIHVDDTEKGSFIMSRMNDLSRELMAQGVTLRDISADAIDLSEEITIEA